MLINKRKAAGVALILIRYELSPRSYLNKLAGQEQPAIDWSSLQDSLICVAGVSREAFMFGNVEPYVDSARKTFGNAVWENDGCVKEHIRVADIPKITMPVCRVKLEQSGRLLRKADFPGGRSLGVDRSASASFGRRKRRELSRLFGGRKEQIIYLR